MAELNEGQKAAYQSVLDGKHTFITGPGGTGKSFLMNTIFEQMPRQTGRTVSLTAMTGCAALLLHPKAKTLHSWAGVGLAREDVSILVKNIKKSRKAALRWLQTDVLVIDEVSMLTPELFEKLDQVGRKVRRNEHLPFGGLQLVFVGDFFQLPPIYRDEETIFLFESQLWKSMNPVMVELKEIVRQKDPVFQEILNQARKGEMTKKSLRILVNRMGLDYKSQPVQPTMLFTRRAEVDDINMSYLRKLTEQKRCYKASTVFVPTANTAGLHESDPMVQKAIAKLDTDAPYNPDLIVAKGAQVMLITNLDPEAGLVNGSRGVVVDYALPEDSEFKTVQDALMIDETILAPVVLFRNGQRRTIEHATWEVPDFAGVLRRQIPLRLAYAVTIHKCVAEDTLLSIPGKGLIPIKLLGDKHQQQGTIYKPDGLFVKGVDSNRKVLEIYKGFVENGLSITTSFGFEIKVSERHPLLVLDTHTMKFIWKLSPEIKVNDYIVVKKGAEVESSSYYKIEINTNDISSKKNITIPEYITEEFGYFIGCMLGNGSINPKTYRFDYISQDIDNIYNIKNILQNTFNISIEPRSVPNRKTPVWRIFFHSKQLVNVFTSFGYVCGHSYEKEIPYSILTSPLSVQKAVLQGLYDTDGGVSPSTINYTTTSNCMGKQIQEMLLNLGIVASRNVLRGEVPGETWKIAYRLNISGTSALKFNKHIGFRIQRKKNASEERFNKENDSLRKQTKSQAFEIPNGASLIHSLRLEMRGDLKRLKVGDGVNRECSSIMSAVINNIQTLRCESLELLSNGIQNIEQYQTGSYLEFIRKNGLLIDTVKSISIVENIQMYDIGVCPENPSSQLPDGHDFLAGGFINHNCQGSTLDSALIDVGSSTFEYGQAYVALSRVRDLESLFIHDLEVSAFRAHPKVLAFYEGSNV